MEDKVLEKLRSSLTDVLAVCEKLSCCATLPELKQVIGLALENDGQLKLLLGILTNKGK